MFERARAISSTLLNRSRAASRAAGRILMGRPEPLKPMESRVVYTPKPTSGVHVDHYNSLTYSALWSCVKVISESLMSMNFHLVERLPGRRTRVAYEHSTDFILDCEANPEMPSSTYVETMAALTSTWGNSYAEIERDRRTQPVNLWPITPDRVLPDRDSRGRLYYDVWNLREPNTAVPAADMIHVKGLGFDGIVGYSVVRMAAKTIGLGMAMQENGEAFFGNSSRPEGYLKTKSKLTKEAAEETLRLWEQGGRGPSKAHRTRILHNDTEWEDIGIPNGDAQWLEGRKFQVAEICRWFRVPPHKLADLERATFSNIEQQSIEFWTDCILPWARRFEAEHDRKLLGPKQRSRYFTRFNFRSILRGDSQSRIAYYKGMRDMGIFSANDVLAEEDMNPIGPEGDKRLVQLNLTTLEQVERCHSPAPGADDDAGALDPESAGSPNGDPEEDESDGSEVERDGNDAPTAAARILSDVIGRALKRETNALNSLLAKHSTPDSARRTPDALLAWCEKELPKHQAHLEDVLTETSLGLAELTGAGGPDRARAVKSVVSMLAFDHADAMRTTILADWDPATPAAPPAIDVDAFLQRLTFAAAITRKKPPANKSKK